MRYQIIELTTRTHYDCSFTEMYIYDIIGFTVLDVEKEQLVNDLEEAIDVVLENLRYPPN